ncbi:hypothetical protein Btru_046888 [Bulinus truncatus]|nr:hypothetical protein Btru_046888 [Bulinus truncatus]
MSCIANCLKKNIHFVIEYVYGYPLRNEHDEILWHNLVRTEDQCLSLCHNLDRTEEQCRSCRTVYLLNGWPEALLWGQYSSRATIWAFSVLLWELYTFGGTPYPQNKIFDEINERIGSDQSPTIQDRSKLTYLNAAILETQRLASLVPHSVPHTCPRDVTVRGYTIPKGSFIMPNLDSVLHDEKIWGHDVMIFKPERFLNQDGQLKNYDELIPFSVGRRACLGESMAKTELFLYLANMLQTFEFLPVDPDHPPPMKYIVGITASPVPYEVRIVSRAH